MLQKFYKYHGAGNDFLLADNRDGILSLTSEQVRRLCDRHTGFGADGVMLLEKSESKDFRMLFFNPDGSCGMMCGNGGRCIVSFAADLGVVSGNYPVEFEAPDGLHTAIVERKASQELSDTRIIRLKMRDVEGILAIPEENAFFSWRLLSLHIRGASSERRILPGASPTESGRPSPDYQWISCLKGRGRDSALRMCGLQVLRLS